jgi:hypothetical protein
VSWSISAWQQSPKHTLHNGVETHVQRESCGLARLEAAHCRFDLMTRYKDMISVKKGLNNL